MTELELKLRLTELVKEIRKQNDTFLLNNSLRYFIIAMKDCAGWNCRESAEYLYRCADSWATAGMDQS